MHRTMRLLCTAFLCLCSSFLPAFADAWTTIKQRGTLIAGVKTDYKPWGYLDEKGNIVGMEADMAHGIARRMGVKLELVPVVASNRIEYLREGKIDVIIATMSFNADRAKLVSFIEPYYYASMVAILTRPNSGITGSGSSLEKRKLCTIAGAFWNKSLAEDFVKRDLIPFKTVVEAEDALRRSECEGFVYDDVVLLYKLLSESRWDDYDLVQLLDIDPTVWGMAVRLEEKDRKFGQFVKSVAEEWHRKGTLLQLEKEWVGQNSMSLIWLTEKVKKQLGPSPEAMMPAAPQKKPAPKQTPATPQQVKSALQGKPPAAPTPAKAPPPDEQETRFNPFGH
jgi:polar amino acid transport system substrate-binding protein